MPEPGLGSYLNGIAGLCLSAAAATLSATILKDELIPDQIDWLGAAGTVTACCVLVIVFAAHLRIRNKTALKMLGVCLVLTLVIVLVLRTAFVHDVSYGERTHHYLVGWSLTKYGKLAQQKCSGQAQTAVSISVESLIKCAGPDAIPGMYGTGWWMNQLIYMFSYLGLLTCFSLLVGAIELRKLPTDSA
jgi:hypothetical protein